MINETRKMRHAKKRPSFPRRPYLLASLAVLLVSSCVILFFYQRGNHPANSGKTKQEIEKELIYSIKKNYFSKEECTETVNEATQNQAKHISLNNTKLSNETKSGIEKEFTDTMSKWTVQQNDLVISYTPVDSFSKNITQVKPTIKVYRWNSTKNTYDTVHKKNLSLTYLTTGEGKVISSKSILQNEANLSILRWVSQTAYLKQSKTPNDILDDVLALPPFTWDTVIDYTPDHLLVHLPDTGKLKNQTVTISYDMIANAIDANFIDPKVADKLSASTSKVKENKKQIALTFDDGPNPKTTPRILETLKANAVHATFFQLGSNAKEYPSLVKQVADEGHEIGSHTFSHKHLPKLPPLEIQKEISDTDKAIYEASGKIPYLIRPPYGATNPVIAKIASRPLIMWNIDSEDWKNKNADKSLERIKHTILPNGIILMHDIQPSTVEMLPKLIDWLKAEGYQIVTINELLDDHELPLTEYFSKSDQRTAS